MKVQANGTYKASESELSHMNRAQLIGYIRTLEHNWETATESLDNQAKYMENRQKEIVERLETAGFYDTYASDTKVIDLDVAIEIVEDDSIKKPGLTSENAKETYMKIADIVREQEGK